MKKRSLLTFSLVSALGLGSIFTYQPAASASKLSDLQNQQQHIINKSNNIDSTIVQKNSQISKIQDKQSKLKDELKNLETSIVDTNEKIREKNQQIADTKEKITQLKAQIKQLENRIEERNQLLKKRARSMQENGGSVNYVDVILTSDSFGDLLDRLSAVNTIVKADQQIMDQQRADEEKLKQTQEEVQKTLADLQGMLSDLQKMKAEFNSKRAQENALMKKLGEKKDSIENEKMSLGEEKDLLSAQNSAIKKAIELEKGRIAEQARQEAAKREAARQEAARQAAAAKEAAAQKQQQKQSASSSTSSAPQQSSSSSSMPAVSSGDFTRPAQGYISSGFGNRSGEYGGFHPGVDIANPGANVPIVAAADGVVSRSYLSSSYGNCIFISHSIHGKIYTTVYAHMSKRLVGNGAVVHKGQQIGVMGSTGESTGQHLHFELYPGPWTPPPHPTAVNPALYINF